MSISYAEKGSAVRALQTHFTNKDYPYLDIAKGSSLLLVNSSDSSDCEDHEGDALACVRQHHGNLHPHHQVVTPAPRDLFSILLFLLRNFFMIVCSPTELRDPVLTVQTVSIIMVIIMEGIMIHSGELGDDRDQGLTVPHRNNKGAQAGSDVVDELLKPLQSYFSVFRTGQYQGGGHHGLLEENGGPPAHNTRSQDKRYRIRRNQQDQGKGKGRGQEVENGGPHHGPPPHHLPGGLPNMSGPPPPVANGYPGPPPLLGDGETEVTHLPPPNMAEPPPSMMPPPSYPPPCQPMILLPGPPPATCSSFPPPPLQEEGVLSEEEQLEVDISNMSLHEPEQKMVEEQEVEQQEEEVVEEVQPPLQPPEKDLFNLFSLSFICKSKDISERRIRLDFSLVAEVSLTAATSAVSLLATWTFQSTVQGLALSAGLLR